MFRSVALLCDTQERSYAVWLATLAARKHGSHNTGVNAVVVESGPSQSNGRKGCWTTNAILEGPETANGRSHRTTCAGGGAGWCITMSYPTFEMDVAATLDEIWFVRVRLEHAVTARCDRRTPCTRQLTEMNRRKALHFHRLIYVREHPISEHRRLIGKPSAKTSSCENHIDRVYTQSDHWGGGGGWMDNR